MFIQSNAFFFLSTHTFPVFPPRIFQNSTIPRHLYQEISTFRFHATMSVQAVSAVYFLHAFNYDRVEFNVNNKLIIELYTKQKE